MAEPEKAQWLAEAVNGIIIRQRKSQAIVEIQLLDYGDDSLMRSRGSNPQRLSHDAETEDNPPNVWVFKRVPTL